MIGSSVTSSGAIQLAASRADERFAAASGYARGGFGPGRFRAATAAAAGATSARAAMIAPAPGASSIRIITTGAAARSTDLDRDYEEYRRENQKPVRERLHQLARAPPGASARMLTLIREHMEVIGSDDEHVGTVDRIAGDRIILAKSDPDSGGVHHSLSCADVGRVEGDKVILDCTGEQAKQRWRDESRGRRARSSATTRATWATASLDRSFEGTYR